QAAAAAPGSFVALEARVQENAPAYVAEARDGPEHHRTEPLIPRTARRARGGRLAALEKVGRHRGGEPVGERGDVVDGRFGWLLSWRCHAAHRGHQGGARRAALGSEGGRIGAPGVELA